MNYYSALMHKAFTGVLFTLFLCFAVSTSLQAQTPILHDISTGDLTVSGTNDYIIIGSTTQYKVVVSSGYIGNITLRNVSIQSLAATTSTNTYSPFTVLGEYNRSNLDPVTKVNIILEGANELKYTGGGYACLQVDQGAQIHISAIDPNNNASGTLRSIANPYVPGEDYSVAGAGIGAPNANGSPAIPYKQGTSPLSCGGTGDTAGGNIIISSGTVTAYGGHGAGIGGGYRNYYNGIIIIYGGIVEARAGYDAAGIGSGCPTGSGVLTCYADISTVIALPPAVIEAYGAGGSPTGNVGKTQYSELGLTGTRNITYINDPNKSLIKVRTTDYEPNANIYLDLTETPNLVDVFETLDIDYDLTKVRVGRTAALGEENEGYLSFRAQLEQNTTFFTDASSSKEATFGRPYLPQITTVIGNKDNVVEVVLPLLGTDISFTDYPSTPLEVGYSSEQAFANAFRVKLEYNDALPMTEVTFALQDGLSSHFVGLQFFKADGVTPATIPTRLDNGDVYYITIQLGQGEPIGIYNDILLIGGKYDGTPLPGYIRRVGMQRVVINDSEDNNFIKVTASPNKFSVAHPTTNTVNLTLNIDHTDMSVNYDHLDVVAKYLVTTIANYDAALVASPLTSSDWVSLNVPLTNGVDRVTTVSFSGKPVGTYYIHWYVESGVAYAHSLTVTNPPRTYGGFGPYILAPAKITLSLDKSSIDEGGGIATGTAILKAKFDGPGVAPAAGISIGLTYDGTATRGEDYTALASITIPEDLSEGTISIVAQNDDLIESLEAITITVPPTITYGGITYEIIIESPLNIKIVDKTDGAIVVVKQTPTTGDASEPSRHGSFRIKFKNDNVKRAIPTKVLYTITGAPPASSYTVRPTPVGEATIPANSNYVDVFIDVHNNYIVEGTRSIEIEISNPTPL